MNERFELSDEAEEKIIEAGNFYLALVQRGATTREAQERSFDKLAELLVGSIDDPKDEHQHAVDATMMAVLLWLAMLKIRAKVQELLGFSEDQGSGN